MRLPTDLQARRATPSWALRRSLLLTDAALLTLVWGLALLPVASFRTLALVAVTVIAGLVTCRALSLYRYRVCVLRSAVAGRLAVVAATTGMVVAAAGVIDETRVLVAIGAVFVALHLGRARFERGLRRQRSTGRFVRDLVAVGHPREVDHVADLLEAHPETGFRLVGYVGPAGPCRVDRLGRSRDAVAVVQDVGATGAVLVANGMSSEHLNLVARRLGAAGVPVHVSSGIAGVAHQRLRSHPVAHEPFLSLEPSRSSPVGLAAKRLLDVTISAVLLIIAAPLLALAAVAIRIDSPGPAIFRQRRVGRNGHVITLHKLRTMTVDAESRAAELQGQNERSGPLFKMTADPRITRVGRVLRATSVDELPQLVDALAGRLSLVGPRPALPAEVAEFDEVLAEARGRVRPGITGLWQVEARHNPSFAAYRHLDLFYAENWSLRLDLVILAATVQVVLADAFRVLVPARGRHAASADPAPSEPLLIPETEAILP